jgi:rhodanese-related sulfurtransferase
MKLKYVLTAALVLGLSAPLAAEEDMKVKMTKDLGSIEVKHNGKAVTIKRIQDETHTIDPSYSKTSRPCPPFCIQPAVAAPGVETIGELELLDYLKKASAGEDVLVVDARTKDWLARGTIPGSVNIPWTDINMELGASAFDGGMVSENFEATMTDKFGATRMEDGSWDFSKAKTLVTFCNGLWCPQSVNNIKTLIRHGYPESKIKWYRGGMQDWESLGLTIVKEAGK